MKRYVVAFGLALAPVLIVGAQAPQAPQTPQAAPGAAAPAPAAPSRWPGKVYLSGENPGMSLREKPGGPTLAQVSFWRIHWSPAGTGHVCYVTTGDGKSPGDLRIGIHDNQKLYDYLTNEIYGVFNQSYKERPFTPVGGAKFGRSGDAIKEHTEICNADKYNVSITWRGLGEPYLNNVEPGRPTNPFGLIFLIIPSSQGEISINGRKVPGGMFPAQAGGTGGTGILAFGETWRRIQ